MRIILMVATFIFPLVANAQTADLRHEAFNTINNALENALGPATERPGKFTTKEGCRKELASAISFSSVGKEYPGYIRKEGLGIDPSREVELNRVIAAAEAISSAHQEWADAIFALCATYP